MVFIDFESLLLEWLLERRLPSVTELEAIVERGVRWAPMQEARDAVADYGPHDRERLSRHDRPGHDAG
ncbi:hypothetical protein [Nocardia sp. NPDC048505]|uniref:hypothetical protein n=1 Tax=unclassified Nocardia TaxID=2637762 RepID=UPI003400D953